MALKHKITFYSEIPFFLCCCFLALGTSITASTGFGVSTVVSPAYVMSLKFPALTFGQWEYITQALLLIAYCIIVRKFSPTYLFSFVTALVYGAMLDLFRLIPPLNPNITPPGSGNIWVRILLLILGTLLNALGVAFIYKTYFYPQAYDFFVKGITKKFNLDTVKTKRIYDAISFGVALVLSLLFFQGINGIGIGTVLSALVNGLLLGFYLKILDGLFEFKPAFPKLTKYFKW